jgi:hypothetical protein
MARKEVMSELVGQILLWGSTIGAGIVFGILIATEHVKRSDQHQTTEDEGQTAKIYQFPDRKAS